jgi:hypothetical protein
VLPPGIGKVGVTRYKTPAKELAGARNSIILSLVPNVNQARPAFFTFTQRKDKPKRPLSKGLIDSDIITLTLSKPDPRIFDIRKNRTFLFRQNVKKPHRNIGLFNSESC